MSKGQICGATFPMEMFNQPFAVCTRAPHKTGDHSCTIFYSWIREGTVVYDGKEIIVSRYRAPKNKRPYIHVAMNEKGNENAN